jgi:hypothetical protein
MERDYTEVKEPKMVQFTTEGQDVEGILLAIQKVTVKDKSTVQFLLKTDDGALATFLATYDLLRKIRREHIGYAIIVKYEGEDREVKTQGLPLRRFKVLVSRDRELAVKSDSLQITDEDIPF